MSRREDRETATLDAADAFERSFAPTDYEAALEAGYDPSDDTIGSRIPLTDPAPFERAVRRARELKAEAWRRERGAGS